MSPLKFLKLPGDSQALIVDMYYEPWACVRVTVSVE